MLVLCADHRQWDAVPGAAEAAEADAQVTGGRHGAGDQWGAQAPVCPAEGDGGPAEVHHLPGDQAGTEESRPTQSSQSLQGGDSRDGDRLLMPCYGCR